MPPRFSQGLRFEIGVEELRDHVAQMRGQVDLLVVLSHVGFPQDVQFAKDVPGIDVIVSGHTHNRMEQAIRSEEHTSELQSLMRNSYAVFCLKKKNNNDNDTRPADIRNTHKMQGPK